MHTRTAMSVLAMNTRFELYLFALQDADKLPESFSHALDIWTHSCLQTWKKKQNQKKNHTTFVFNS